MNKLRIAVSQFPVSNDIQKNERYIEKHTLQAANEQAHVIHFPETALSGYDTDVKELNWSLLEESLNRISILANKYNIYIVLGIHQKQPDNINPLDSVYIISDKGHISGSYSKTKLYKNEKSIFSCNNSFHIEEINNVKCGFLICFDSCFPALFQYYRENGVKVLFLSYYNAKNKNGRNDLDELMKAQMRTRAADNLMYISGSNSSSRYSRMPSGVASPDGKLTSLPRHKPGILIYDYPDKDLGWTYDNCE